MNKRGISAVVATVLIILITVAAVTIIWTAVIPMIKNQASFENELVNLDIETAGGYTVWDEEKGVACVQVAHGTDDAVLEDIAVIFERGGSTETGYFGKANVPGMNQKKTMCFDLGTFGKPSSIKVAPVFSDGMGTITSKVENTIPVGVYSGDRSDLLSLGDRAVCGDGVCAIGEVCSIDCAEEYSADGYLRCVDGVDNDEDGSIDCADSDCSTEYVCKWTDTNYPESTADNLVGLYASTGNTIYKYNPIYSTWTNISYPGETVDNFIGEYASSGNTIYRYNPVYSTWTNTFYPGVSVDNLINGYASSGNTIYKYSGTWTNTSYSGATVDTMSSFAGILYVSTGNTIYKYTSDTWTNTGYTGTSVDIMSSSIGILYVSTGNTIYKYTSGTWTNTGYTGTSVDNFINEYASSGNTIYKYASDTWTNTGYTGDLISGFFSESGSFQGILFICAEGDTVYQHRSIGAIYDWVDVQFPGGELTGLSVVSMGDTVVIAVGSEGIYKIKAAG